jgi:hypothetical protein
MAVTGNWKSRGAEAMHGELQFQKSTEESPERLHIPVRGSRACKKHADTLQVTPYTITPTELAPGAAGFVDSSENEVYKSVS